MRLVRAVLLSAIVLGGASAQSYTIQTVAGREWNMPATSASLSTVAGVATDSNGNVYMSLREHAVVVRLEPSGILTLVAGTGVPGYSGDNGPANLAELKSPTALAVDTAGAVYIVVSGRVRRVSHGVITTVAGADVPSSSQWFDIPPAGIAVDSAGNLYIAASNRIIKISEGVATTVAGPCCGPSSFGDNIPAAGADIHPNGIAVDGAGNLYIADGCYNIIRKVADGVLTTVAGTFSWGVSFACGTPLAGGPDGRATSVALDTPTSLALDSAGTLYFTEGRQHVAANALAGGRLRKLSNGSITTIAGGGVCPNPFTCAALSDNIPATSAVLNNPGSAAVDTAGNLYFPDGYGFVAGAGFALYDVVGRLRKVANGIITTVAGTPTASGEGSLATAAQLNLPAGIAFSTAGDLYIADSANNLVRQVAKGVITTVAGNRTESLYRPRGVAFDPARGLYVTDGASIFKVVNGTSSVLLSPNQLNATVASIALDSAGNLYIADTVGNRILEVSNAGITTVAGTGTFGFAGDNGPATNAQLAGPSGVALDRSGNLYITDLGNQRVRKITNGIITTIAGNGTTGSAGDNGPAIGAQLNLPPLGCVDILCDAQLPAGIAVDAAGAVYFADSGNHRVRKVFNGVITTVAGNGTPGFSGDTGLASNAQLNSPSGISIDTASGKLYISDSGNNRVRALVPSASPTAPVILLVANAFGENTTIAPNTWVEIKGTNLATPGDVRTWQGSDFVNNQLPTALDGVTVTMNGKDAYLYYISPGQINVLTPPDLSPGPVETIVTVLGVASAAYTTQAQPNAPAFFVFNGGPYVAAVHADSNLIGPPNLYPGSTTPAKPGEIILLFANGFGPTSPPVVKGSASQSAPLPVLPLVNIGGSPSTVQFAGLISPGLYQFNVVVPATTPDGDDEVTAFYNGATTQRGALLTVKRQ